MTHSNIETSFVRALSWVALILLTFVFIKNAWIAEDSYIIFRSIEQLFQGNGPIWNPHERVQVFTSALWFLLLAISYLFSSDLYLNSLIIGFLLTFSSVIVLRKHFSGIALLVVTLFLVSSNGFFDFTSSGLENSLAYLIISSYFVCYVAVFTDHENKAQYLKYSLMLFGLILLVRHDLLTLLLFPTAYLCLYAVRTQVFSIMRLFKWLVIAALPMLVWSAFALIYYGSVFPNTFYAKLNTGLPKGDLLAQGVTYIFSSLEFDTITVLVILFAVVIVLRSNTPYLKWLVAGILLNLAYVIYAGGDFMRGRFLSYAYLLSMLVLVLSLAHHFTPRVYNRFLYGGCALLLLYNLFYWHTPLNSPLHYHKQEMLYGIADERGFYFSDLSVWQYLIHGPGHCYLNETHTHNRHLRIRYLRKTNKSPVIVTGNIGYLGTCMADLDQIVVDFLALSDPFLASFPVTKGEWARVGHYQRTVPADYVLSLEHQQNLFRDAELAKCYAAIQLLTQSDDLFNLERLSLAFKRTVSPSSIGCGR